MKSFLAGILVCMLVASAPAAAQQRVKVDPRSLVRTDMERSDIAPTERSADIVPDRIYSPPPGYRVAYSCDNECRYWLVENDTLYDRAVYAAQSLWMSAVALLGMMVCLGLLLAMYAIARDVLRRDGAGTKKVLDEMAS